MVVLNENLCPICDTLSERFSASIVIEISDTGSIKLELWGASTKHPDSIFQYDDFKESFVMDKQDNIVAWLAECASKMLFRGNMYRLLAMATQKTAKDILKYL